MTEPPQPKDRSSKPTAPLTGAPVSRGATPMTDADPRPWRAGDVVLALDAAATIWTRGADNWVSATENAPGHRTIWPDSMIDAFGPVLLVRDGKPQHVDRRLAVTHHVPTPGPFLLDVPLPALRVGDRLVLTGDTFVTTLEVVERATPTGADR